MDTSTAFDLVCHEGLLNKLHSQGITVDMWKTYKSMYTDVRARAKWHGQISGIVEDKQGLASTSAEVFNRRNNKVLKKISSIPKCLKIGTHLVNAVMVADDLALLSTNKEKMKQAISMTENHANQERYLFSKVKTKHVQIKPKKAEAKHRFNLNGTAIKKSMQEKHLGMFHTSDNINCSTIEARKKSARRSGYMLFGAGFHGLNGLA